MPTRTIYLLPSILLLWNLLAVCGCAGEGTGPATCQVDADCDDGLACNGVEGCQAGECLPGQAVACDGRATCVEPDGRCACEPGWAGEACDACAAGFVPVDDECLPGDCVQDPDCDDGLGCNGAETCGADRFCQAGPPPDCGAHGACQEPAGTCLCEPAWAGENCTDCAEGYQETGGLCLPDSCALDADCDDGLVCTGAETCADGVCAAGQPVVCDENAHCVEADGSCACDDGYLPGEAGCTANPCSLPRAPVMSVIHAGAVLAFEAPGGLPVQVGTSPDPEATEPDAWRAGPQVVLPEVQAPTALRVFARVDHPSCLPVEAFAFTYEVRPAYAPPPGQPDSLAVPMDDPGILGWAAQMEAVDFGDGVDEQYRDADQALGPAQGNAAQTVSLGQGGVIRLAFDPPIADGPGPDLAVFENSFSDTFLELGLVEVSSDGETFLRFDHAYLGTDPVATFGTSDPTQIGGLAGKYRAGFGTPFDLAVFAQAPEVRAGQVDLQAIRFVRILDVYGDGTRLDSFGHPIFDPTPTTGSAGFDLDAIAVLNAGQ